MEAGSREPPDAVLVAAWRRGDQGAGERLFDRYYDAVVRFFRNKTDAAACNDLVQETFLACVEGLVRIADDRRFRSYLFAVAYRLLCRHYRTRRRDRGRIDYTSACAQDLSPSPTGLIAARDEQRLLLAALRRIPVDAQVILELVYWERMTAAEIGAVLEIPLGTAKTRIRAARLRLRALLVELADSPGLLESAVGGLDTWAASLRERAGRLE